MSHGVCLDNPQTSFQMRLKSTFSDPCSHSMNASGQHTRQLSWAVGHGVSTAQSEQTGRRPPWTPSLG